MELPLTEQQFDAIKNAKHLPDVLRKVLDTAKHAGDRHVLHLTYAEAVALNELCSWNVHMDPGGEVTPETRVYDEMVKAIITHPDY